MSDIQAPQVSELKGASEKIKRPLNAFIIWSKKRRRVIANENPQMHNFDISRKLGLEWQKLSEQEKAFYFEEAKRLKEEHKERYPNYKYQPRKRDKSNKRGKMFQGAPFHFNFFPTSAPYYEGTGYTFNPISEPRLTASLSPKTPHHTNEESHETTPTTPPPSSSPSSSPSQKSNETTSKTNLIRSGFRPPSEGFIAYRSPCESTPYVHHLRPGIEWSSHWYQGTSARYSTVPYYGCLYPWHSRPEYHS